MFYNVCFFNSFTLISFYRNVQNKKIVTIIYHLT